MSEHTFTAWLHTEVAAARCVLLKNYEQRDKLRYIDGPALEQKYMESIGEFERTVIQEEMECELLERKQQMIQAALNRRESIDEEAIDEEVEKLRKEMMSEAAGNEAPQNAAKLSDDQKGELQKLYREIVQKYHPGMHPELTAVHRQLYEKAQEAYRLNDLAALRLVNDMLESTQEQEDGFKIELILDMMVVEGDEVVINPDYATDYALAGEIYGCFQSTLEEATLQAEQRRYQQLSDEVLKEIDTIRLEFPYTAEDMLGNPEEVALYKEELDLRLRAATAERERRIREIRGLTGKAAQHG